MAATDLPKSVPPMLAAAGKPFDSDQFLYEVKWDGMRAVALVESDRVRAHNRHRDITGWYPELDCLAKHAPGAVLDGELVALNGDKPDFPLLMSRQNQRGADPLRLAAKIPVHFMVFDLLYDGFESLLDVPLSERRQRLVGLLGEVELSSIILSEGLVGGDGAGLRFHEEICSRDLEGTMAKRLDSRYLPGQRVESWIKCKQDRRIQCLILGYRLDEDTGSDLRTMILAAPDSEGALHYVGRVGSGLGEQTRTQLLAAMRPLHVDRPLVDPKGEEGIWLEPRLFCEVKFLEWTDSGVLRSPVFVDWFVAE